MAVAAAAWYCSCACHNSGNECCARRQPRPPLHIARARARKVPTGQHNNNSSSKARTNVTQHTLSDSLGWRPAISASASSGCRPNTHTLASRDSIFSSASLTRTATRHCAMALIVPANRARCLQALSTAHSNGSARHCQPDAGFCLKRSPGTRAHISLSSAVRSTFLQSQSSSSLPMHLLLRSPANDSSD